MRQLKIDMHVHSFNSVDGVMSHQQILSRAKKVGLDGLSITDHNHFNREETVELQQSTDLILIPGEEISTELGHVLAYFISEPVEPWRNAETIIDEIHSQEGLAILAHPYRNCFSYPPEILKKFDGFELFNARSGDPEVDGSPNNHTKNMLENNEVAVTAGSDAHVSWALGNGYIKFEGEKTLESVRTNILNNEVQVQGKPNFQSNKIISQFNRLRKDSDHNQWLKYIMKSLAWLGKDIMKFLMSIRESII